MRSPSLRKLSVDLAVGGDEDVIALRGENGKTPRVLLVQNRQGERQFRLLGLLPQGLLPLKEARFEEVGIRLAPPARARDVEGPVHLRRRFG